MEASSGVEGQLPDWDYKKDLILLTHKLQNSTRGVRLIILLITSTEIMNCNVHLSIRFLHIPFTPLLCSRDKNKSSF